MRLNKVRILILISGITASCTLCSCSGRYDVTRLENGYYHFKTKVDKDLVRWTLMLRYGGEERIITEALVSEGEIKTLMPTPEQWSDPRHWHIRTFIMPAVTHFGVDSKGMVFVRRYMPGANGYLEERRQYLTSNERVEHLNNLASLSQWSINLFVETPVKLENVEEFISQVTPISKGGMRIWCGDGTIKETDCGNGISTRGTDRHTTNTFSLLSSSTNHPTTPP